MQPSNRSFATGLICGVAAFIGVTLVHAHVSSSCGLGSFIGGGCADGIKRLGFPLVVWEEGGYAYHSRLSGGALLVDLVVMGVAAVGMGLLCRRRAQAGPS